MNKRIKRKIAKMKFKASLPMKDIHITDNIDIDAIYAEVKKKYNSTLKHLGD